MQQSSFGARVPDATLLTTAQYQQPAMYESCMHIFLHSIYASLKSVQHPLQLLVGLTALQLGYQRRLNTWKVLLVFQLPRKIAVKVENRIFLKFSFKCITIFKL